ncbi:uncharacterized protein O3Q21_000590 [Podargus strigoides]
MSPEPGGLQPQHPDLQLDQVHLRQRQEVHRRRLRDLALSLGGRGQLQPRSATGAPQEEGRTEGESSVLPGERSEQRHERELRCESQRPVETCGAHRLSSQELESQTGCRRGPRCGLEGAILPYPLSRRMAPFGPRSPENVRTPFRSIPEYFTVAWFD